MVLITIVGLGLPGGGDIRSALLSEDHTPDPDIPADGPDDSRERELSAGESEPQSGSAERK